MSREQSVTKDHIIKTAAKMISESNSDEFRINDVAKNSNVGVPTIYYHFESRGRLIAEAQFMNYSDISRPIGELLTRLEQSVLDDDEATFGEILELHARLIWSAGRFDKNYGVIRVLTDIWSDALIRSRFFETVQRQFDRWIATFERAQALGWLNPDVDAKMAVWTLWSSTIGQAISFNLDHVETSPESFRDFYMRVIRN